MHINKPKALAWPDLEVCERWHRLFKGTALTQKFASGQPLTDAERLAVKGKLDLWRNQLCDISWYMRLINEPIAREANKEDRCTGRFWESRFKSQALCDDKAVAACMAYVDLNPIRSCMADTPEASEHTSVKERIEVSRNCGDQPALLAKFIGNPRNDMPQGLPFHLKDYLELVDWTGRIIRDDKRGVISETIPPILDRLDIEPKYWLIMTQQFESRFKCFVGGVEQIQRAARKLRYLRTPGLGNCKAAFQ